MSCFIERKDYIFNTVVYQKIEANEKSESNILDKAVDLMKTFEKELNFYNEESIITEGLFDITIGLSLIHI